MAAGAVSIPWYANGFRGDAVAEALAEIAPVALRYGATSYSVYRNRDDRYRFTQYATFPDKASWERYWGGPEFVRWRTLHNGWVQVPVVYAWNDVVAQGAMPDSSEASAEDTVLTGPPGDGDAQA
jgi:quinol monooxygenase YgiN